MIRTQEWHIAKPVDGQFPLRQRRFVYYPKWHGLKSLEVDSRFRRGGSGCVRDSRAHRNVLVAMAPSESPLRCGTIR
jgi:hypothetical protein